MLSQTLQACLAGLVWTFLLAYLGVPLLLAALIAADVALLGLAALRWRAFRN